MMVVRRAVLASVLAFLVSACTNVSLPYDRSTAETKSIAVVTPAQPGEASAILATSVGQSFGLIGALIDAGLTSSRNAKLRTLLSQQHFTAAAYLQEDVTKALEGNGYAMRTLAQSSDRREFLNASAVDAQEADAYLDLILVSHGYQAAGIGDSAPWRPYLYLRARLVRKRDSAVLMQQVIAYNPIFKRDDMISITADPTYQFKNFDTLLAADPAVVTRGLRVAIEQSAQALATLLR